MKYALISVSDTSGLIPFARALNTSGFSIIATTGTGAFLKKNHLSCIPVNDFTGTPALFGGRIKTLHPRVLGGILFRRKKDIKEARKNDIPPIDLVAVNLYPFADRPRIENIDIGGVTLLRAAAKNHDAVTVICDPNDYKTVADQIIKKGAVSAQTRKELAAKVFALTAHYDARITQKWSRNIHPPPLPHPLPSGEGKRNIPLRYGENPHQQGWFYQQKGWNLLQGKPLSYCNIIDTDAAWSLVCDFRKPTAACVKHATPCGVASHNNITQAFQQALDADSLSAFGVVIGLNRPCPPSILQRIINQNIFVEVIVAPGFDRGAVHLLKERPNVRAIVVQKSEIRSTKSEIIRSALGGTLMQTSNTHTLTKKDLRYVTKKKPTPTQIQDLLFAWHVVKHTLSNAIIFAKDRTTIGVGSGQTSRIDAVRLAAMKAGRSGKTLADTVMASDAFFPFPDSIDVAAELGVSAIIQPGGSKRDTEVIAEANKKNMIMVFTGVRAFRH